MKISDQFCASLSSPPRRNGIPRWPHRRVKSLQKNIETLRTEKKNNPDSPDIDIQLVKFEHQLENLLRHPESYQSPGKLGPGNPRKRASPDRSDDEDDDDIYEEYATPSKKAMQQVPPAHMTTPLYLSPPPATAMPPAMMMAPPVDVRMHPNMAHVPMMQAPSVYDFYYGHYMYPPSHANFVAPSQLM